MRALLLLLGACGSQPLPATSTDAPAGQLADGRTVEVSLTGETIGALTPASATTFLWPPIVDSHVHLSYWPIADQLAASGVTVAIDLAAPERTLAAQTSALHVLAAGPMLTRDLGYPLNAWGSDGYGIGCADAACITQTVDRLASEGVRVVKLAMDATGIEPSLVATAVAAAHAHGLPVAVHAMSEESVALAASAGADILAHTPYTRLSDATIAAWRHGAVISTLAAFGGDPNAIDNLRRLRAAGTTVLYGTDLGNLRDAGPSADEVALLREAGLDDEAITAAMTTVPLAYWKTTLGEIAVGGEATFLILDADPRKDADVLIQPREVFLRGKRLR